MSPDTKRSTPEEAIMPIDESELEKWWHETNGTGTAACPKCTPSYVCTWHQARLNDLSKHIQKKIEESASYNSNVLNLTSIVEAAVKNMKPGDKIYKIIKLELKQRGYWKNLPRGKPWPKGFDPRK